ncbi:triose-phosphate isomerase [Roseisolibacter sp. H3M3-2]|uniref:triose-phosphate isomerase n=1 Tax=Roseisolibacter sp. H3M3-2 TaxID=3031323 RepID=UPI0023DA9FBA|nr:triose-phosphate isomerase [Roseisolibacter sp. H3M3-2]MDF1501487.1 triose-phosphate isomerase [Roseisolibacter sp. H3M3-2]
MLKPILAANWKMHHGPTEARAFFRDFLAHTPRVTGRTVVFFPPAITLRAVQEALQDRPEFLTGVQHVHDQASGAFTGEISAGMARDAGARMALVGHSERRTLFGETDEATGRKCEMLLRAGVIPMLCVGERLEEREQGMTEQVVLRQLEAGLAPLDAAQAATVLIAYEPVWAIGTGRTATPEDATTVHGAIRRWLRERVGEKAATMAILYGGSVNRGNAKLLLAAPDVDGLLVGGASLDPSNWTAIVNA